jgi:hypothetical protein
MCEELLNIKHPPEQLNKISNPVVTPSKNGGVLPRPFMKKLIPIALSIFCLSIVNSRAALKPVTDGPLTLFYEEETNTKNSDGTYHHVWHLVANTKDEKVIKLYNITCDEELITEAGIKLGENGFKKSYTFEHNDTAPVGNWAYDIEVEGPTGTED